ncbi:DUF7548 family protein [Haladaptatus halobius]|uniref:DUF7548 family protein n=1 Tax=Haladaptatus halobius TaxID=2884875 RepID=UPI001D0AEAA5|nr:hypothetical protein [Haladaptatus halobius]
MSKQRVKTANWSYIFILIGSVINTVLFLSILTPTAFMSSPPVQIVNQSEPFGLDTVGLLALFAAGIYFLSGLKIIASEITAVLVFGFGFLILLVALIWTINTSSTGRILSSTSHLQNYNIFIVSFASAGLITATWYTKAIIQSCLGIEQHAHESE